MNRIGPSGSSTPLDARDFAEALFAGPAYAPPYEGALQDEFAWHLVKYLREDARLDSEVSVETRGPAGPSFFTMDFVVTVPGPNGAVRRAAFECGGEPSLRDHQRRQRRDAALMAAGAVDAVYRLRGSDLHHHVEDCLFLIAQWEPALFSERGQINLRTLASPEAKVLRLRPEQPSVQVVYALEPQEGDGAPTGLDAERALWHAANGVPPSVVVRRFDARFPDGWAPYVEIGRPQPVEVSIAAPVPLRKAS